MGCIQSKSVSRPGRAASKTKVVSNGTQNKQENYSAKTNDNNFDLHLRSPRNEESTSGMTNGNLGSGSIHFAEDLEPVSSLPDTMTICTVSSDRHGALSVSNVNIKQRGSAHSSRVQSSKSRDDDLSIEELDTELDDFSKLSSESRYIHPPGQRINPATTDILLPRRKQTPYPTNPQPVDNEHRSVKHDRRKQQYNMGDIRESGQSSENNSPPPSPVVKKSHKGGRKGRKKKKEGTTARKKSDQVNEGSENGGTITIENLESVKTLLGEDTKRNDKDDVNDLNKDTNVGTDGTFTKQIAEEKTNKVNTKQRPDTTGVYAFSTEKSDSEMINQIQTENNVQAATRAIVSDYLKDIDVSKKDVNPLFKKSIEHEKEKARLARKRKRTQENKPESKHANKAHDAKSKTPSDQEINNFFRESERSEGHGLKFRTVSKSSLVSIASMEHVDSEYIFDQSGWSTEHTFDQSALGSENTFDQTDSALGNKHILDQSTFGSGTIFDQSAPDMNILSSENTLDDFNSGNQLIDMEDEFEHDVRESMDDKSLHSTTSMKSVFGIKPYKTTPQSLNPDNCSLRDIGFDVQSGSSTSNVKTKQKLMYSRHARRPMSESVLRLAGKPPIPPSGQGKLARPHSDTVPRGMQSYSRYMNVDTDLF